MKLTKRELPWHHWFAWRPVEDWDTGQWYWLETVWRKFRVDGSGSRWYYKPVLSAAEIAAKDACDRERRDRMWASFLALAQSRNEALNRDSTPVD